MAKIGLNEESGRPGYVRAAESRTERKIRTPHTFRRSSTTELIRAGANLYHIKELLGQESLDTVRHYAKLTISYWGRTPMLFHVFLGWIGLRLVAG